MKAHLFDVIRDRNIAAAFDTLQNEVKGLQADRDKLRENISFLKRTTESDKVREAQVDLAEAKASLRRGFPISKDEDEKIVRWQARHEAETGHSGNYVYHFSPTAIGVAGWITCTTCHHKALQAAAYKGFDEESYDEYIDAHGASFEFQPLI